MKTLSRYAQKRRQGLVPMQYGARRCVSPPVSAGEAKQYQEDQYYRDQQRRPYIAPIVRVPILRSKVPSPRVLVENRVHSGEFANTERQYTIAIQRRRPLGWNR